MEFKVWDKKKEKNLEETVESAFRQIEEKKYVTDLVTAGINEERIYKLGFAFAGKEVLVKEKIQLFLENKICDDKKLTSCEKKYKITKNLSDKYELQILSDGMTEKEEHENGTYHKRRSL